MLSTLLPERGGWGGGGVGGVIIPTKEVTGGGYEIQWNN